MCALQTFTRHFIHNGLGNREHSHMHAKIADPENRKEIYGGNNLWSRRWGWNNRHERITSLQLTVKAVSVVSMLWWDFGCALWQGSDYRLLQDSSANTEAVPRKPAAAPAPLAAGSSQNQIEAGCDDLQDPQHRFTCIPESSHQLSRNNTSITFIWHYTAHRTIHQDWAREACLPMRSSSVWNSLPSFIINSLTTFKSRL